jgi:chaperonin 10 Kd subunit
MKQLFGNRVALRVENEDETTESGIVIPGQKDKKKYIGEVVMVGKGLRLQNGEFSSMDIQPGMRVVYEPYAGKTFYENDIEYLIVKEPDIVMQV